MSILFDLIFLFQHYVLYHDKAKADKHRQRRLESVSHPLKQYTKPLI
jgi:hypothetical protein